MAEHPDKEASSKERRSLGEYFERVWGQALLAVSAAEDEATRATGRVAQAYGWGQDEMRRQTRLFTERLAHQRRELEKNLEESVQRAMSKVKVPRREALQEFSARLDRIEKRIAALEAPEGQ
jgi:Poly(hydroxyalcanoate) granule associated protein (phasin)